MTGCLEQSAKINGVFSLGEKEYSREEYLIAQVYYHLPLPNFYPAEFQWDGKAGVAHLSVWKHEAESERMIAYDFMFDPKELEKKKHKEGNKTIYEATLFSLQSPQIFIEGIIRDYKVDIDDKYRIFYFDREDMDVTLHDQDKIIGYFKGAKMDLLRWEKK